MNSKDRKSLAVINLALTYLEQKHAKLRILEEMLLIQTNLWRTAKDAQETMKWARHIRECKICSEQGGDCETGSSLFRTMRMM